MISKICGAAVILFGTVALPTIPALADGDASLTNLAGSNWQLVELTGFPVSDAITSTLVFSADGVGGNGGCNGELVIDGSNIDISRIIATQMACAGLPQEQAYFAALEAATTYGQVDGDLVLTGSGGKTLARLSPQ